MATLAENIYLDKKSRFFRKRKRALLGAGYEISNYGHFSVTFTLKSE